MLIADPVGHRQNIGEVVLLRFSHAQRETQAGLNLPLEAISILPQLFILSFSRISCIVTLTGCIQPTARGAARAAPREAPVASHGRMWPVTMMLIHILPFFLPWAACVAVAAPCLGGWSAALEPTRAKHVAGTTAGNRTGQPSLYQEAADDVLLHASALLSDVGRGDSGGGAATGAAVPLEPAVAGGTGIATGWRRSLAALNRKWQRPAAKRRGEGAAPVLRTHQQVYIYPLRARSIRS